MSLDFDIAPYCNGECCTNLLTSRADYERGYCGLCWEDIKLQELVEILEDEE